MEYSSTNKDLVMNEPSLEQAEKQSIRQGQLKIDQIPEDNNDDGVKTI